MEENYLPPAMYLQRKFYEWFRDPVSADPSLPAKANYPPPVKDLQEKFYEWFGDSVPADPLFPAEANHSNGDPVPANLSFPIEIYDSHDKTRRRRVYDLRKLIVAFKNVMMHAEIKYLSIGLFIGMCVTGLFLTGLVIPPRVAAILPTETTTATLNAYTSTPAPTSTSAIYPPTSTYTPTPTLIRPTSTATATEIATATPTVPSPTPTFSDTLMGLLQGGYLSQVGPLSLRDQFRVYESSLKYVRTSTEESRLIGEQINGPGYGAPSNICGPLSLAILQEAGIVRPDLDPHTFWMLNPGVRGDRSLLSKVFSPDRFENIRFQVPLNKVDWRENPLYPGDFIYIYAGWGGTFEHMLVVNRVDSDGRAYAVTNHMTSNGFIISEVLLYDPDDPNAGMFPAWTARPNAEMGSTGFAGYELWRLRSPSH
jgi:hypothetical protein